MFKLEENELYYYDPVAAERPIKFAEQYVNHYEGKHLVDTPFVMLEWQAKATREIYGWKRRDSGLRRFKQVYCEIGKGAAKSPWLAILGLYGMLGENEAAPQVYSIACDFQQANVTFGAAKKYLEHSPKLQKLLQPKQYSIDCDKNDGVWRIMSGTAKGKHGLRPTMVLFDEVHEAPNDLMYLALQSNMHKRPNSLFLCATNAGESKHSLCGRLHEDAMRVLDGTSNDDSLYPLIYAADKDDDWLDEKVWRKSIPSLGTTIRIEDLRIEATKAKESPKLEARFRRLYLSQWIQGTDKWLDMRQWDACTKKFSKRDIDGLPLIVSLDLSESDDLSAVNCVWEGNERLFVRSMQWVPRGSAEKYEARDSTPFKEWEAKKQVRVLETVRVDKRAQRRIAKYIIKLAKRHNLQCVCYDPWRASYVIYLLEQAGIACVKIEQNLHGLAPGCKELEGRMMDRTISIYPNDCLRWEASHVEVMEDNNGNKRPVKPGAKGKYSGRRGNKIDGIAALVTSLSQIKRREVSGQSSVTRTEDLISFM